MLDRRKAKTPFIVFCSVLIYFLIARFVLFSGSSNSAYYLLNQQRCSNNDEEIDQFSVFESLKFAFYGIPHLDFNFALITFLICMSIYVVFAPLYFKLFPSKYYGKHNVAFFIVKKKLKHK